jgi:membrane fusion protein (multidrug efflux system)
MPQQLEMEKPTVEASGTERKSAVKPLPAVRSHSAKRVLVTSVIAAIFALGVIVGLIYLTNAAAYQSTDDAFVDGHIIPVSSKVAGRVQSIYVLDNQLIAKGDKVVELDPRDFDAAARQKEAAFQSAKAQANATSAGLDYATAHVKTIQANVESDQATADADKAQNDKAQSDLRRYEGLFRDKVVSPSDVDQYRAAAKSAQATYDAALKKVASDEAQVGETHAQVAAVAALAASDRAKVNQSNADLSAAKLNQSYTEIDAPEGGWVTQKSVEPGAYVQAGQNLFALVPQKVWVTANFKEDQIRLMRKGQPVEIDIDALHGAKFEGRVDSIQAGSGARFSLLPPENATGNYVKVVQRVPVKIVFDNPVNKENGLPLGPGESVVPTVKVGEPHFSLVSVIVAFALIAVGVIFIFRRGLGKKAAK